jgi:hypothetical protein
LATLYLVQRRCDASYGIRNVALHGGVAQVAYIIVSDGYPDAGEFDNNRIWFDERDPDDRRRALLQAERRREYLARRRAGLLPSDALDPNAAGGGGADVPATASDKDAAEPVSSDRCPALRPARRAS